MCSAARCQTSCPVSARARHVPTTEHALKLARSKVGLCAGVMHRRALVPRNVRLGGDSPHPLQRVDEENTDEAATFGGVG